MKLKYDLVGQRFGRLLVLRRITKEELPDKNFYNQVFWECQCDCGNIKIVSSGHLRDGHTRSCGCLHDENARTIGRTHGKTKTRLHAVWTNMLQRCTNPNNEKYKNYGARGICVCDEWRDFIKFYNWAIENGYDEEAEYGQCTIDRKDVNGNYCPENCRWVDSLVQMNNRTDNRRITYKGETHTLAEWSRILGEKGKLFKSRIDKGWDVIQAFEAPFNSIRNRYRVECEGRKFYTVKDCAEYYNVPSQTMRGWVNGHLKMPSEWNDKGLKRIDE